MQDKGVVHPFVFAKMEKFLPLWIATDKSADDDSDEEAEQSTSCKQLAKALGVPTKKPQSTMPLTMWMLAYDAYTLAAAATEQWPVECALAHKTLVLKVAAEAKREGRAPQTAVVYDEMYRRHLAEMTYANALDVTLPVLEVDKTILALADARFKDRGEKLKHAGTSHDAQGKKGGGKRDRDWSWEPQPQQKKGKSSGF